MTFCTSYFALLVHVKSSSFENEALTQKQQQQKQHKVGKSSSTDLSLQQGILTATIL